MIVASSSTNQYTQNAGSDGTLIHDQDGSESKDEVKTTPCDPVALNDNWECGCSHTSEVPRTVGDTNREVQQFLR